MKILAISGTHPRHLHYVNKIHNNVGLAGVIFEEREFIVPEPPSDISEHDRKNFILHFKKRDEAENQYFGGSPYPDCPTLKLKSGNLNSKESMDFVKDSNPDVVLIYGPGMVRDPLFSALPRHTINLHGGLSPRYRGAATLFWPFYFMEPAYSGVTFHYIVYEPDAGNIIHQVTPPLDKKDGIHDVGCKAIVSAADDMLKLLDIFKENGKWEIHKQKGTGKNFLQKDFKPEHLRVNYDLFNDEMVKHYLEGKLYPKEPKLVRQFK